MGFSKYSMLALLAVAFTAFFWRLGGAVFKGVTKWLLWSLAGICTCAGLVSFLSSEGNPLPILGGVVLWVFATYAIKVAGTSSRRR